MKSDEAQPYVKVTSPNSGEKWQNRTRKTIRWSSSGISGNVKLVIMRNGNKVGDIAGSVSISAGSYSWEVGKYQGGFAGTASGYKIRIETADGKYSDESDRSFSIAKPQVQKKTSVAQKRPSDKKITTTKKVQTIGKKGPSAEKVTGAKTMQPSMKITYPGKKGFFLLGNSITIRWSSSGMSGNAKLVLLRGNNRVGTIATGVPVSSGSYKWTVGQYQGATARSGSSYKIQIEAMNGRYICQSEGSFKLAARGTGERQREGRRRPDAEASQEGTKTPGLTGGIQPPPGTRQGIQRVRPDRVRRAPDAQQPVPGTAEGVTGSAYPDFEVQELFCTTDGKFVAQIRNNGVAFEGTLASRLSIRRKEPSFKLSERISGPINIGTGEVKNVNLIEFNWPQPVTEYPQLTFGVQVDYTGQVTELDERNNFLRKNLEYSDRVDSAGYAQDEGPGSSTGQASVQLTRPPSDMADVQGPPAVVIEPADIELIKTRLETRITKLVPENPAAKIVIPLLMQRIEEESQKPLMVKVKDPAGKWIGKGQERQVDVSGHLKSIVQAYNKISPSIKQRNFHPRYANLKAGQKINRSQLGKDILQAVVPEYRQNIQQAVREMFSTDTPSFKWNQTKTDSPKSIKGVKPLKKRPSRPKQKITPLTATVQRDRSSIQKARPRPSHRATAESIFEKLKEDSSSLTQQDILQFPNSGRFIQPETPYNEVHNYLREMLDEIERQRIREYNTHHHNRNFYKYTIELDWFKCFNAQQDRTYDKAYWQIDTLVPRFDTEDTDFINWLHTGKLFHGTHRITGDYKYINTGESRVFSPEDRSVISNVTYEQQTSFTIGLYEHDFSKFAVKQGMSDEIARIKDDVLRNIRKVAEEECLKLARDAIVSLMPGTEKLLNGLIYGESDARKFLDDIGNLYDDTINTNWAVVAAMFGGDDIMTLIMICKSSCPAAQAILWGIKVGLPIMKDLIRGNFRDGFLRLLKSPIAFIENIIDTIKKVVRAVKLALAAINPDDFIGSQTITFSSAFPDVVNDAQWVGGEGDGPSGHFTNGSGAPAGCGPSADNSSIMDGGRYAQPVLRFEGSGAKYRAYYNVKREIAGGREIFGYYLQKNTSMWKKEIPYRAKTDGIVKVSVSCHNSDSVPFVRVVDGGIDESNLLIADGHQFHFEAQKNETYMLALLVFGSDPMYGYVTFEEREPPPDYVTLSPPRGSFGAVRCGPWQPAMSVTTIQNLLYLGINPSSEIQLLKHEDDPLEFNEIQYRKDATFRMIPGRSQIHIDISDSSAIDVWNSDSSLSDALDWDGEAENVSFESATRPGYYLTYRGVLAMQQAPTTSEAPEYVDGMEMWFEEAQEFDAKLQRFNRQATFVKREVFDNEFAFESCSSPGYYIYIQDGGYLSVQIPPNYPDSISENAKFIIRRRPWWPLN